MSLPYHAWTHRPKAQGGTDPISTGAVIPFIEGFGPIIVETPWTVDGEVPLEDGSVWTNDTSVFGLDTGAVTITPPGVYFVRAKMEFAISPLPDTTTISPDITIEMVPPGDDEPVDEGGAQASWIQVQYQPSSFAPTTISEAEFITQASFQQMLHTSGGVILIPYVRASAGSADWEAEVSVHVARLGDLAAPFASWVYLP